MRRVPCVLMRGGTSRGPVFLSSDLPADQELRDAVLIAVMGSPHALQVDGIGGGNSLTSKVAIVSPSTEPGVDIDYEFVQVLVDRAAVDRKPNCGNMLSATAPFAIEAGLFPASDPETTLRIRNINTGVVVSVVVQTPGGSVEYEGSAVIDGVPGTAAPIRMVFPDVSGAATGHLFPAGSPTSLIGNVEATLIDGAIPIVMLRASDFGLDGAETPDAIDADATLFGQLETVRRSAALAMGLGDVTGQVIPKIALLSAPRHGGTLTVRYLTPDKCHHALAVTGAVTLALATLSAGTIASALADLKTNANPSMFSFEHPGGKLDIAVETRVNRDGHRVIERLSTLRTARRIFEGSLLLPDRIWPTDTAA